MPAPSAADRVRTHWLWLALAAVLTAAGLAARADDAVPGSLVYTRGQGQAPIEAVIADGRVKAPGSRFACINCHKADGLGVVEGGLKPRDITWPVLTRPRAEGGRGYDAATVARAITEGVDADGLPLGPGMPRFRMQQDDLAAIVAYLHRFEGAAEPGVSGEAIRIATLLPLLGHQADTARAVERFLDLAILDINTRRRFDGRRIVRISVGFDPDLPGDGERAVADALAHDPPFAFLGDLGLAPNSPARQRIASAGVPEIAPLTAPLEAADHRAIWIEPSVADQARALVEAAVRSPAMPYAQAAAGRPVRLGLFWPDDADGAAAAAAARDEARLLGAEITLDRSGPARDATDLRAAEVDAILLFGSADDASHLLVQADRLAWRPVLLGRSQRMAGLLRDAAAQDRASIFLVTSYGGVDPRSRGAYDFRRVAGELGGGHPDLLRDAYVGAKLLEHALAAIGAAPTRARLLAALASTRGFETGVMAPLSFGPDASRRGLAQVMWLDPARRRLVPLQSARVQ